MGYGGFEIFFWYAGYESQKVVCGIRHPPPVEPLSDIARDRSERMRIVVGQALNDSDWSMQILYYFIGQQLNWFLAKFIHLLIITRCTTSRRDFTT